MTGTAIDMPKGDASDRRVRTGPRRNRARLTWLRGMARLLGVAGLLATAACAGPDLPPLPDASAKSYLLGAGDQVRVITFGEDQLTGDFRVNDTGNVNIPLLGSVPAKGLTTGQLAANLSKELIQRKLFRDPSVVVEVAEYRPIFILGEVSKPGQYPFQPGMTVLSAVAIAGGFTYRAVENHASIVRTEGGVEATEGDATRQAYVAPGDVITIHERLF